MVDASAIASLEQAAANLDRLLCIWTKSSLADAESATAASPKLNHRDTINYGIHSLWRLVAIHKSIEQLKNPPIAAPIPEPPSKPGTPISRSPDSPQPPNAPQPPDSPPRPARINPVAAAAPCVPSVPCVPSDPSLNSVEAIAAATGRLSAEIASLMEANGLPAPERALTPDQFGINFLDALSARAKYPGAGKLIDAIRADTPP